MADLVDACRHESYTQRPSAAGARRGPLPWQHLPQQRAVTGCWSVTSRAATTTTPHSMKLVRIPISGHFPSRAFLFLWTAAAAAVVRSDCTAHSTVIMSWLAAGSWLQPLPSCCSPAAQPRSSIRMRGAPELAPRSAVGSAARGFRPAPLKIDCAAHDPPRLSTTTGDTCLP